MCFEDFIDSVGSQNMKDLSEKEKERAVHEWLTDSSKKKFVLSSISEYLIDDWHLARSILLDDAACGKSIKDSIYSAFESDMQDTIDGLM